MSRVEDAILDDGLTLIDTLATTIWICSQQPASYGDTVTYGLGYKSFAAGAGFGAPANYAGGGRQVASVQISDGEVIGDGVATHWAVTTGAALYATGQLTSSFNVQSGSSFSLAPFLVAQRSDGTDVSLGAVVIDNGLDVLALANKIHICSQEPTAYADIASYSLGEKDFGIGNCFGAITDYADGRKISSVEITDGEIMIGGTPVCWAVVDDANSRLLAIGNMSGALAVEDGDTFTLASFTIDIPAVPVVPNWWLEGAAIDLGFAENKYFDGAALGAAVTDYLTCSRSQTVVNYVKNSDGQLTSCSADTLRISDLGLLIESARTNIALYSSISERTSSQYTQVGCDYGSTSVAPDGTNTAQIITRNTGAYNHTIFQSYTTTAAPWTFSCYFKANGYNFGALVVEGAAFSKTIVANLTTGAITDTNTGGSPTNVSYGTEVMAGGFRLWITLDAAAGSTKIGMSMSDAAVPSMGYANGFPLFAAPATDSVGIILWGVQMEAGSSVSSYIPITDTPVQRSADVVSCIGDLQTDVAAAIGSIVAKLEGRATNATANIVDSNGTNLLGFDASNHDLASLVTPLATSNTANRTADDKLGIAWDGGGRSLALNGGTVATDSSAQTPSSTLHLRASEGYLERLTVWTSKLAGTTLRTHTTL